MSVSCRDASVSRQNGRDCIHKERVLNPCPDRRPYHRPVLITWRERAYWARLPEGSTQGHYSDLVDLTTLGKVVVFPVGRRLQLRKIQLWLKVSLESCGLLINHNRQSKARTLDAERIVAQRCAPLQRKMDGAAWRCPTQSPEKGFDPKPEGPLRQTWPPSRSTSRLNPPRP